MRPFLRDRAAGIVVIVVGWLASPTAMGQGIEPRLPGAVTKAPAWLTGAPFDVGAFFAMPPASHNAAPLYLEALIDLEEEMRVCLPPSWRDRGDRANANRERITQDFSVFDRPGAQVDAREVSALAASMRETIRKLDAAQRRPRCVFAAGITYDAPVPHIMAAREVSRLCGVLAAGAVDRGEIGTALDDLKRMLRLDADIRVRGPAIAHLVGTAIDRIALKVIIPRVLASPKLRIADCDRLIAILREHEARVANSFDDGVKATYIMERVILRTFEDRMATVIESDGRAAERRLDEDGVARFFVTLASQISDSGRIRPDDPSAIPAAHRWLGERRLNFAVDHRAADAWARAMLSLSGVPYRDRAAKVGAALAPYDPKKAAPGQAAWILFLTLPNYAYHIDSDAHDRLYLGAAECLAATRRWQLVHGGKTGTLAEICRSAGLPRVPVDPYSGGPIRMTVLDGRPAIYSVGTDGDDDYGLKDAEFGRHPDGDWIFRLETPAGSRRR